MGWCWNFNVHKKLREKKRKEGKGKRAARGGVCGGSNAGKIWKTAGYSLA